MKLSFTEDEPSGPGATGCTGEAFEWEGRVGVEWFAYDSVDCKEELDGVMRVSWIGTATGVGCSKLGL